MSYLLTQEDLSTHLLLFYDKYVDRVYNEVIKSKYKKLDYCCEVKTLLYAIMIEISGCYDVIDKRKRKSKENPNCLSEELQNKLIDKLSDLLNTYNFPNTGDIDNG